VFRNVNLFLDGHAINTRLQKSAALLLCLASAVWTASLGGQEVPRLVNVVIRDGKLLADEVPVDPTPRIEARSSAGMMFGLTVDGTRITCTPEMSVFPMTRIDNQVFQPGYDLMTGQPSQPTPLPPGPFGKKRLGTQTKWTHLNLHFTQVIELVPSQLNSTAVADQKRRLDTVRISYLVENRDQREHLVEFRTFIDTMIKDNDGALFAAPTTAPGEILDGVELKGRTLPEYLQVLEQPNVKNTGFVATMTLKSVGKMEGPTRVVLAGTQAFRGEWDALPQKAGGDSAVFLYWAPTKLKPGEKREMIWAYGGGIASNPGHEDNVLLTLGGSFEPGKLFTVQATVDDPVRGQALTLELPAGMERVEGHERQAVPVPQASGRSVVLWKARVAQVGDYELKVRSSTGVTHVKSISIQAAK
jgi:hypothetical protein